MARLLDGYIDMCGAGSARMSTLVKLRSSVVYLHTHHLYGTQHNDPNNLKALCIACHSEQPGENHRKLETEDDYHTFMEKYGSQWCEVSKLRRISSARLKQTYLLLSTSWRIHMSPEGKSITPEKSGEECSYI